MTVMHKVQAMVGFVLLVLALPGAVRAQGVNTSWSQCTDGRVIVRCETYDCPKGDTNKDGRCSLTDTDAKLTDARNDSFCANPISGCGQVRYFPGSSSSACIERVEESGLNCDLYAVANPSFTPRPSATPTASPKPSATPAASPTPSPVTGRGGGGDSELPKTGPEHLGLGLLVLLLGATGVFWYEKHKTV